VLAQAAAEEPAAAAGASAVDAGAFAAEDPGEASFADPSAGPDAEEQDQAEAVCEVAATFICCSAAQTK
jgi:hypothetical protein